VNTSGVSGTGTRTPITRFKGGHPSVRRCRIKLGRKGSNPHLWVQSPATYLLDDTPVKREEGIEPSPSVWRTDALPLSYTRKLDGVRIELTLSRRTPRLRRGGPPLVTSHPKWVLRASNPRLPVKNRPLYP
jgi:hypothetical protein